ncbi:hypothetical protein N9Q11_02900 [Acidimicrobiia bacterium]|jgi:hypothetical protein|nr:hypothetical protein [Acidimicrobiia bacterium]|tara:strand:+ start:31 stop:627 length:597 start_codon:yes stop_codon:yes gene_type:complete
MENFSTLFMRLKKVRGLSNKQIASFTGANLKEVKKWDSGTSFPTDKKVIIALEGLLGKEIMDLLEGRPISNQKTINPESIEDSLFTVDRNKKVELKSGIFNKFKSEKQVLKEPSQPELFTYENITDTQDLEDFELQGQRDNFETAVDEKPYIGDSKQLGFYLSRNIKTILSLLFITILISRGFQLFLESITIIIDNLI